MSAGTQAYNQFGIIWRIIMVVILFITWINNDFDNCY